MSALSVIIPTRNRSALLQRAVDLLRADANGLADSVEIVVVDDGSGEAERAGFQSYLAGLDLRSCPVRFIEQRPSGPAAARNRGIQAAAGEIVLFLGDDILARPGLLRAHLKAHTENYPAQNVAILGLADLDPEFRTTPFARWWRRWNFRYDALLSGTRQPDCGFFFTNNLSLKRAYLLEYGLFDEAFPTAAYEDIELGYRLTQHGLRVVFAPEAEAYHYHRIDVDTACRRMEMRGRYYDLFRSRTNYPAVSKVWRILGTGPWMHPWLIYPIWRLADLTQDRFSLGPAYIFILMYYFWVGRGVRRPFRPAA